MAIACLRLFTLPPLPPWPDLSVPRFLRRMALATVLPAALPSRRPLDFLRPLDLRLELELLPCAMCVFLPPFRGKSSFAGCALGGLIRSLVKANRSVRAIAASEWLALLATRWFPAPEFLKFRTMVARFCGHRPRRESAETFALA